MKDRYYQVTILCGPKHDVDDIFNPKVFPSTYEEAIQIMQPWVEQGWDVIVTTRLRDDGDKE
ncbi:MAG: hypothetical protein E7249_14575 [Paenibacillaceae bacterium]|nr:hypothetical protein [Paenibacillaceae bacterium]